MDILIIGATGYIGAELYAKCREKDHNVVGTFCSGEKKDNLFHYSIGDSIEIIDSVITKDSKKKYAVICAGQSNISLCKSNNEKSYQINVIDTIKLIEQLKDMQYRIIFCSTDNVYNGEKGYYKETDKINPINEYGKMKAKIEEYLLKECPTSCIIRISKVVGIIDSEKDMLRNWQEKALKDEKIYCIRNNYFSPIHINDVVNCILEIIQKNLTGIYNLCGNKRYSRIDLCKIFLEKLNLTTQVIEKNLEDFGFNDQRPLDTSMDNQKFVRDTDYQFCDLEQYFADYSQLIEINN